MFSTRFWVHALDPQQGRPHLLHEVKKHIVNLKLSLGPSRLEFLKSGDCVEIRVHSTINAAHSRGAAGLILRNLAGKYTASPISDLHQCNNDPAKPKYRFTRSLKLRAMLRFMRDTGRPVTRYQIAEAVGVSATYASTLLTAARNDHLVTSGYANGDPRRFHQLTDAGLNRLRELYPEELNDGLE